MQQRTDEASTLGTDRGTGRPGRARLCVELAALRGDVAQLEGVLGDAVGRLVRSFEAIDVLSRSIGSSRHAAADEPCRSGAVEAAIGSRVAEASTALQFHDIASQILRKVESRIDAVADLTRTGLASDVNRADRASNDCGAARVDQTGMAVGTVELF